MITFQVHGYDFGDTLLEDVYFDVSVGTDHKIKAVTVSKDAESYFSSLNTKMWLDMAEEYAEEIILDIIADGGVKLLDEILEETVGQEWPRTLNY